MSLALVSYCMAAPKPLVRLLKLFDRIRFGILSILFYLIGISYCSTTNPQSGSQPRPDPSFVKSQLPLIDFSGTGAAEEESSCVFCLEKLEAGERVREVGICRHSFHGECIDRWIDLGQLSCPTCRADLLPKSYWRRLKP